MISPPSLRQRSSGSDEGWGVRVHSSPGSAGILPAETRRGRDARAPRRVGYPRCEHLRMGGNLVSPDPCLRAAPAQPLPRAGVWGTPVSPHPHEMKQVVPGRATPAHTLLGEGLGKPGFPTPLLVGCALPRAGVWGTPVSPRPCTRRLCSHQPSMRFAHNAR